MTDPASSIPNPPAKSAVTWLPTREDMSLILEASADAVFVTDRDGRILFLNPMAQKMIGRKRDVIGHKFHDLFG